MKLLDTRATDLMPTSLFLTRAEFKKLYPHKLNSRINYIFKGEIPKEVADGEAKLLMKKYSHVIRWKKDLTDIPNSNRAQELQAIKYNDLKKMGSKLGLTFKEVAVKTEILIENIITKEIAKEEELARAKANKGNKETE